MPERPNPALWDEPEMHRALAGRDIGTVYQILVRVGILQTQIAQLTEQTQSEVSEIINGRQVMAYDVLLRIADGLGVPHGHMGLAYADADPDLVTYSEESGASADAEVDDDMVSRRILGMASVALLGETVLDGPIMQLSTTVLGEPGGLRLLIGPPGELGRHDIAWIKTATARFREFDHQHGGAAVYAAASGMAEHVIGALRTSPPLRELFLAVAELLRISAWTAYDAGHRKIFWTHIATALELAREAGHPPTVAVIVDDAARAEQLSGRHKAAAKLFELVTIRRKPSAVDWSLLAGAYVPSNPNAARHALDRAADAPGVDSDGAQGALGGVRLLLGDYAAAVEAFGRSLPHRSGRAALTDTASLAIAHLQTGEIAVGVRCAESAFSLCEKVRSTQGAEAMRKLSKVLSVQTDSTAQDLARRVATVLAA